MNPESTLILQFDPAGFGLVVDGRWLRDDPASDDPRVNMGLAMGLSLEA